MSHHQKYVIQYFDSSGRVDVLLLIAEVGSVPYTFDGVTEEDWPSIKPKHRYGQVPCLTIPATNQSIYQTTAIARFLAQEGGLYPSDRLQATQTEEYVASVEEAVNKLIDVVYFTAPENKEEALKKFSEGILKTVLQALSVILEKNGGFLLNGELSWADLVLLDFLLMALDAGVDLSPFKTIVEFKERIEKISKVKAYLDSDRNLRNVKV